MASLVNSLICAGAAIVIYACIGLPLALRVASRPLALMLAPALGWAIHSVVALPLFFAVGLSRPTAVSVFVVPLLGAIAALYKDRAWQGEAVFARIPALALAGAALLALVVMAAVLPKISSDGVALAGPIFDHSKIAMIDEMARLGVPPGNPFFGGEGSPARLSYYYLWHFSAAEFSLLLNISGWEADAGLSWFTGFASLGVLIGLSVRVSGRAVAALWVIAFAAGGSLRPLFYGLFGVDRTEEIAGYQSGFGGWLFQTSWAPQHSASATVALLALYLLVEVCKRPGRSTVLLLALTMAAGFESSTWVGGVAFPLAAAPVALVMLARAAPRQRMGIVIGLAIAALLALLLISPFLYDQWQMTALRGDGPPIKLEPNGILGEYVSAIVGGKFGAWAASLANGAAYWLIYLPVEFPAFYLTGLVTLYVVLKDRALSPERRALAVAFALAIAASLTASWLLVSTLGDNNDLGWRAILPGMMLLMVFAAAGLSRLTFQRHAIALVAGGALVLLAIPDGARFAGGNIAGTPGVSAKAFAATPELWQAVRRVTPDADRVANNPLAMEHVTPWSVNIGWALMGNRRSCYANAALVGPFSALPKARQDEIEVQFVRTFAGQAKAGDIEQLATQFKCATAVVTPEDGAWTNDPFASSTVYRLAEGNANWRIYRVVGR
ncbi:MAG: hypothetical protein PSV22_05385 [Pseudolabrys sp.]|nr:hypothetical protein [Pseudolabrys sp.]